MQSCFFSRPCDAADAPLRMEKTFWTADPSKIFWLLRAGSTVLIDNQVMGAFAPQRPRRAGGAASGLSGLFCPLQTAATSFDYRQGRSKDSKVTRMTNRRFCAPSQRDDHPAQARHKPPQYGAHKDVRRVVKAEHHARSRHQCREDYKKAC